MTIEQTFDSLKAKNQAALVVYGMAGYPSMEKSMECFQAMDDGGADMIEIGVPFSDPVADGPAIQNAGTEALRQGTNLAGLFKAVRALGTEKPRIMMSSINPLMAFGAKRLFRNMSETGFSGLIVPDLPVEESDSWREEAERNAIAMIFLATPVSPPKRLRLIASRCGGFVYCVSLTGTTGVREGVPSGLREFLERLRRITDKPLAVGFGISTPGQVRRIACMADGVIVGSRLVEAVGKGEDVGALVRELKKATLRSQQ